jgi:hypothetical protein
MCHKPQPNGTQKTAQTQIPTQNAPREVVVQKIAATTSKEQKNSHGNMKLQRQPASKIPKSMQKQRQPTSTVNCHQQQKPKWGSKRLPSK